MSTRYSLLIQTLTRKLGLLVSICIGVFLFILFFQPFPLDKFDFNNRLLFVAGFAGIVFIFVLLTIIVPIFLDYKNYQDNNDLSLSSYLNGFISLTLSSVAFAFYLRYVGSVSVSFFIMFKIVFICAIPQVILHYHDIKRRLIQQNKSLVSERKIIQKQIEKFEEDNLNKSIEIISENNSENMTLPVSELIYIQSANNYVEVAYLEGTFVKKKLVRNTLKNIEQQIKQYSNFIRCHRTCIVNMHYIEKLNQDYGNHWLKLKVIDDKIPVSRQYLLKIREAL